MLRALAIRHFAIIEKLELDFDPGFSAITGETGAGKSILIDALGLLLGDRADTGMIAAGQDQAELSARFELGSHQSDARAWLKEQAMDEDDELVIRRILSSQGSSRAWINGRSATVSQLGELGELLVEIHGQHEHQQLEKPQTQRRLLDQQIPDETTLAVRSAHADWQSACQAKSDFDADAGDPAQLELLRFQVRELADLALAAGEYEQLETEQERLARSDEIRSATATSAGLLDSDDQASVRTLLIDASARLERVKALDPELASVCTLLNEARINIDEAISTLERFDRVEEDDPERLATINRRLEKALDLGRKHRTEPDRLPALAQSLAERLERLENQGEQREQLNRAVEQALARWQQTARKLSKARQEVANQLAKAVNVHLAELGMDQARLEFEVQYDDPPEPARHGGDRIRILFSANPGQPPRNLGRIASGGELSRVSLALMIAARPQRGPVVRIFDEVDAGVGGATARVVGQFLRQVADQGQAFCVTHLAQVAACAEHQFRVVKTSSDGATDIEVERLTAKSRKMEIARMLGGDQSVKSLEHAAEMLKRQ